MTQFIKLGPSRRDLMQEMLGQSLGEGLAKFSGNYFANKSLENVLNSEDFKKGSDTERSEKLLTALQPYGEIGQGILQQRLGIEQKKQEEQSKKSLSKIFDKLQKGEKVEPEEFEKLDPASQKQVLKQLVKPEKAAPGGLSGQPVSPEQAAKINEVLNANKEANADDLRLAMDNAGILPAYSNPYVENRRRQDETKATTTTNQGKIDQKERFETHKLSQKQDDEILEGYKVAKKQEQAIKDSFKAIQSKNIKPTSLANVFKGTFGEIGDKIANAFLNEDQAALQASIPILIEGWKDVFGVRISDADLKVIQDKLPSIGKSQEANEAILKIIEKYTKPKIYRKEIADEIKKENKGFRSIDFTSEVENRLEKRLLAEEDKVMMINPKTGKRIPVRRVQVEAALQAGGRLAE